MGFWFFWFSDLVVKVLVFLGGVEYNRDNEFGLVGAVRGDYLGESIRKVCFRQVAQFGYGDSVMLMLVCQVFSRTSINVMTYFGA